jgi:hypothetical protein
MQQMNNTQTLESLLLEAYDALEAGHDIEGMNLVTLNAIDGAFIYPKLSSVRQTKEWEETYRDSQLEATGLIVGYGYSLDNAAMSMIDTWREHFFSRRMTDHADFQTFLMEGFPYAICHLWAVLDAIVNLKGYSFETAKDCDLSAIVENSIMYRNEQNFTANMVVNFAQYYAAAAVRAQSKADRKKSGSKKKAKSQARKLSKRK